MSNNEFKFVDDTRGKELRHKSPSIADDEFETPDKDYYEIIHHFNLLPELDAFATMQNAKCTYWITIKENAFVVEWVLPDGRVVDVWVNHPHSEHPRSLWRAEVQYQKHNMNIIMIIPANVTRTGYWHDIIEPRRFTFENQKGHIHVYFYWNTITFLKDGKPTKDSSRNAYVILIWRKKIK